MKSLVDLNEQFEIETKPSESNVRVHFKEIKNLNPPTPLLNIILLVSLDKEEYLLECFAVNNGIMDEKQLTRLHSIKVEGPWTLKTLKSDLLKIVRREFTPFRGQYYPF